MSPHQDVPQFAPLSPDDPMIRIATMPEGLPHVEECERCRRLLADIAHVEVMLRENAAAELRCGNAAIAGRLTFTADRTHESREWYQAWYDQQAAAEIARRQKGAV